MLAFSLISGFTIGLFYLPAIVAMLLAACVSDSEKNRDASVNSERSVPV